MIICASGLRKGDLLDQGNGVFWTVRSIEHDTDGRVHVWAAGMPFPQSYGIQELVRYLRPGTAP